MKFFIRQILTIIIIISLHPGAYCHQEPPKTIHEKLEQEKERLNYKKSGIKTVIIWNSLDKNKGSEKKYMMSKSMYDTNGNVVSVSSYSESGTEQNSIRYIWNESNLMTEQITTDLRKEKERTIFLYDSNGLVKKIFDLDSTGSQTDWFDYEYNTEKNTITLTKFSRDSSKIYTIRYTYQDGSSFKYLIEAEQWDNNGTRAIKIIYKIENGKRSERQLFLSDGSLDHILKYTYFADGQFKEILKMKPDGSTTSRRMFEYNKGNHLIKETEYDASGNTIRILEYEYKYF